MFTEERQKKILELMQRQGRVHISDLANRFEVSEVTLRADLSALARRGYLTRTHGGAVLRERSIFPGKVRLVMDDAPNLEQKKAVGKCAAGFIENGMNVFLDAGTTILEIARNLHDHKDLTVITDSIPVAVELSDSEGINVIMTGGSLRKASLATIGPESWSMLESLHVDRAFIGARGVSLDRGFFCGNMVEGESKKRMMASAEETFVVIDSSKFGSTGLVPFAGLGDFDYLVTDSISDPVILSRLKQESIKIISCETATSKTESKLK